jgi:hypothetical protein
MKFIVTAGNQNVLDSLKKSLNLIEDSKFVFSNPEKVKGNLVCTLDVISKHSQEKFNDLFRDLSEIANELGLLLSVSPADQAYLTVVLRASTRDALDQLVEAAPYINMLPLGFTLNVGEVQGTVMGYFLVCDVSYSTTKEFVEHYFKNCCDHYKITYEIYEGAAKC